jgi:hypothetical protein
VGEQGEADSVLARGIALADGLADTELTIYGEDPRIICRIFRGLARCLLGYPAAALRIAGEGLALAYARNDAHPVAWSLVVLAVVHDFVRDPAKAEQASAEAIDIAREHRFPHWLAFGQRRRGWALCQLGDTDQGLALLEAGLRRLHATGQTLVSRRISSRDCLGQSGPRGACPIPASLSADRYWVLISCAAATPTLRTIPVRIRSSLMLRDIRGCPEAKWGVICMRECGRGAGKSWRDGCAERKS